MKRTGFKAALFAVAAVTSTGTTEGLFRNEAIKIPMPAEIQRFDRGLRAVGPGSEIDAFVLSMNRAAERATPSARSILQGTNTSATEFLRAKSTERPPASFLPIVSSSLNEVRATKRGEDLVGRWSDLPFVKSPSLDLDRHATGKALDGLFQVPGEEERRVRKDPAARLATLLKEVFAESGRGASGSELPHRNDPAALRHSRVPAA